MTKIKFSGTLLKALSIAMDKNLPFALYIFPSQRKVHFFASTTIGQSVDNELFFKSDWKGIVVDFFHPQDKSPMKIACQMSAKELVANEQTIKKLPEAYSRIQFGTTSPTLYMSQINKFVGELKRRESGLKKAVLCRTVSCMGRNVVDVAQEYFSAYPDTFRYLYYSPQCGMWLGASPELLLDFDYGKSIISTMSLAGTKPREDSEPWSGKNINEHNIVTQYIYAAMKMQGLEPNVSDLYEKPFGSILHLCNDITAHCESGCVDIAKLLRTLSPTPALCGYPKHQAMKLIESTETFDRMCYGGWVAVKDEAGVHAYVNLRCASVHAMSDFVHHYCVYTGGGIMPDSNYVEEWTETAKKAHTLCSIISLPNDTQCIDDLTDLYLTINPEFKWKKTI